MLNLKYPLLHAINDPADLRLVPREQLRELTDELRGFLLESVAKTGGISAPTWARWS